MCTLEYIYLDSWGRCPYPDSNSWKSIKGEEEELRSFLSSERESGSYLVGILHSERSSIKKGTSQKSTILWDLRISPICDRVVLCRLPVSPLTPNLLKCECSL